VRVIVSAVLCLLCLCLRGLMAESLCLEWLDRLLHHMISSAKIPT
jgi:hypothetical protein